MSVENLFSPENMMHFMAWLMPQLEIGENWKSSTAAVAMMMMHETAHLVARREGKDSETTRLVYACGDDIHGLIWRKKIPNFSEGAQEGPKNRRIYMDMTADIYKVAKLPVPEGADIYREDGGFQFWDVIQTLLDLTDPADPLQKCSLLCILHGARTLFGPQHRMWQQALDSLIPQLQQVLEHRQEYAPVPGDPEETRARQLKLRQLTGAAKA